MSENLWKCQNGHRLGVVKENGNGSSKARQLYLFRYAITDDHPENADVIAVVEGHVMNVRCDICGALRTWVPGEAALKRLLASRKQLLMIGG